MFATIRYTKSTSSPRGLHVHSSSPRACVTFCVERRVEHYTMEAVVLQPTCFHANGSRHRCRFFQMAALVMVRLSAWVFCGSQAEAAATASGRRSGSCHHDIRHPWPLARRLDSICGSAASRCKVRHRRPLWNTSAWQRQQAPRAVLSLARESPRTRTTSRQTNPKAEKVILGRAASR